MRTILSGLGWNTSAQLATTILNVAATPFLLFTLGASRYGVFALVSSFRGLLSNLDGGFGPSASRFFAVYAGAGDRRRSSALLCTVALLVCLVVAPIAAVVGLLAPQITLLLHASPQLRASATLLIRLFMPLLLVAAVQGMLARLLSAEHRWGFLSRLDAASTALYLALAVVLVSRGFGLVGLFWAKLAEEGVMLVVALAGSWRLVEWRHLRLLPRAEIRDVVRFAGRVQVAEIASSFGNELNALVIGVLFPVRFVTYYSVGNNFATQLEALPVNALGPIAVTLGRTFGRRRLRSTVEQFTVIQRLWVRSTAAWPLVGAIAAAFGIVAWLGPSEHLAGLVALVLLLGQAPMMLGLVMDVFCKAVDHPGLESRYLGLATAIDIALVVPLGLTIGLLGVPIGMAAGDVAATFYLLRLARREVDHDLRSFFAEVPKAAVLLAALVTAGLEVAVFPLAPRGAGGLALCAVPAVAGLGAYGLAVIGPSEALALARGVRSRRARAGATVAAPVAALAPVSARPALPPAPEAPTAAPPAAELAVAVLTGAGKPDPRGEAATTAADPTEAVGEQARDEEAGEAEAQWERAVAALGERLRRLRRARHGSVLVVVSLRADDRKEAAAGPAVLAEVAASLRRVVRDGDAVLPLGRDAIAVFIEPAPPRGFGGSAADRIDARALERRLATAAIALRSRRTKLKARSLVVGIEPDDTVDPVALLSSARRCLFLE